MSDHFICYGFCDASLVMYLFLTDYSPLPQTNVVDLKLSHLVVLEVRSISFRCIVAVWCRAPRVALCYIVSCLVSFLHTQI